MNPIKVKQTEPYKYGEQTIIVCKGKLLLIPAINTDKVILFKRRDNTLHLEIDFNHACSMLKPIIISETENMNDLSKGDAYYDGEGNFRIWGTGNCYSLKSKVTLARPENFSPEHLQAIVNGTLKDGDDVLIECEALTFDEADKKVIMENDSVSLQFKIKLTDNHITLFPVKKEEGWNSIFNEAKKYFKEKHPIAKVIGHNHVQFEQYLKENYNPPIKKIK